MSKKCSKDKSEQPPNDIWKDPGVVSALKSGRSANDIMVISCPNCSRYNYYNQGSLYWCRFCKQGWYCCSEGEEPPVGRQYLYLDMESPVTLADTITDVTDGYHNETRSRREPSLLRFVVLGLSLAGRLPFFRSKIHQFL